MSEQDKLSENSKKTEQVNESRRKLAKAGLIGGALISLPGKSALANTGSVINNCTVSGNLSGNTSKDAGTNPCETSYKGLTPGYWKNKPQDWSCSDLIPNDCTKQGNPDASACGEYDFQRTDYKPGDDIATRFGSKFGISANADNTCTQVLWFYESEKSSASLVTWSPHALDAHTVAAYLNACKFPGEFPYSPQEVVALYQQHAALRGDMLLEVFSTLNELGV